MSRYLVTVWPFSGHVHPSLAVAHALRVRGHEVAFYTGAGIAPVLTGQGFQVYPFKRIDEEHISNLIATGFPYCASLLDRFLTAKRTALSFKQWIVDTIPSQVADLTEVLSDFQPDVILCDLSMWAPILVLHEAASIPVAVLSVSAACILPGPEAPFWGQGWPRPRTARMRLQSKLIMKFSRWASMRFRSHTNSVRAGYGLGPIDCSATEFAGRMPLYLVPSAPEFDYERRDLPPSVQYVGPCLWDKASTEPAPAWLAKLGTARPLIYVTEATVGNKAPFLLKAAADGLRDSDVDLLLTTGPQRTAAEVGVSPRSGLHIEPYVPQSDVLPRAAVMVTIGGSGGVLAALNAGVPLVIVPTEWDRPENAQRVVEAGAGIRIAPSQCTPERIRDAVMCLLQNDSYRRNAVRLSNAFRECGGPARAAELLEQLGRNPAGNAHPVGIGTLGTTVR